MVLWKRMAIAGAVVLLDLVAFAVPLTALLVAYVVLVRPPRFLHFVVALYADRDAPEAG
jgi:hypothetical protein